MLPTTIVLLVIYDLKEENDALKKESDALMDERVMAREDIAYLDKKILELKADIINGFISGGDVDGGDEDDFDDVCMIDRSFKRTNERTNERSIESRKDRRT